MNVAGVALADGRLLWARTGVPLAVLDRVVLQTPEAEIEGTVIVAPDQLLRSPAELSAEVLRVVPRSQSEPRCDDLPGAALPPLGTRVTANGITGLVTALDPVAGTILVTPDDGGDPVHLSADTPM
jgi:hypothetical protein